VLTFARPVLLAECEYDAKAVEKRLKPPGTAALLTEFAAELRAVEPFDVAGTDKALHAFAERKGMKSGDLVHPVRVAVTGTQVGFGLFDTLAILGRQTVLRRMAHAATLAG
jgi:glutamyl/glutaminyl-tRNA synthetase